MGILNSIWSSWHRESHTDRQTDTNTAPWHFTWRWLYRLKLFLWQQLLSPMETAQRKPLPLVYSKKDHPSQAVLWGPNHRRRRECCGTGADRDEKLTGIQKRTENLSEVRTTRKQRLIQVLWFCSSLKEWNRLKGRWPWKCCRLERQTSRKQLLEKQGVPFDIMLC